MFERFTVIPSIDLKSGDVVRLERGEMTRATIYGNDPAATARAFAHQGAELIHIVDLDGAIAGAPRNLDAVRKIRGAATCPIDVSGGLRSAASVREVIRAGADFVSIGSAAFLYPDLIVAACEEFSGRVFGSLDTREGRLAIKGWVETSDLTIAQAAQRFQSAGVAALIVTDISRDGTQAGANTELFAEIARMVRIPIIASGGVARLDDIRALKRLFGLGVAAVITGRAIYERRFTLPDAISAANAA